MALRLARAQHHELDEANAASNLAAALRMQGRLVEAEGFNRLSVALSVRLLGADAPGTAIAYTNLAVNLNALARYREAEPLHRHAVAIGEAVLGKDDPQTALYLDNQAQNLAGLGRYEEARGLHTRALTIRRARLGDGLPVAVSLIGLAGDLDALGRTEDAEPLWREALALRERLLPPDAPGVANALHNLAANLVLQRRSAEAEPLFRRAMTIYAAGKRPYERAMIMVGWAKTLADTGETARAETAYRDALADLRVRLPAGHPRLTEATAGLALVLATRDAGDEALALLSGVLRQDRATLGETHPEVASSLTLVGRALMERGDVAAAAMPLERAVTAAHAGLPADYPIRILAETALAKLLYATTGGDRARADALIDAAMAGADARIVRRRGFDRGAQRDRRDLAEPFDLRMDADWLRVLQAERIDPAWRDEAFLAAQRGDLTTVGAALADTEPDRNSLTMASDANDRRDVAALAGAADDRKEIAARRATLSRDLAAAEAAQGSRRGALDRMAPVSIGEVQALLDPDEALLFVRTVADASHVWLVTRDAVHWSREPDLAAKDLTGLIARLRGGVANGRGRTGGVVAAGFDREAASDLHRRLIAPVAVGLVGRHRLLVVSGGPLGDLPLGLLLDQRGEWLSDRLAVTSLPSPGALKTLRCGTAVGCPPRSRPAAAVQLLALAETDPARGKAAPPWRAALPAIAAGEVTATAARFGEQGAVVADVTETGFRIDPRLADARYVLIAAHGIADGPRGEPGLVLAPPIPGSDDDGFLSASEAAGLRLSADLVILSACDTAAGDGAIDAEAFSGLARGFLLAGARSVLASHWRVSDSATAALVTALMDRLRAGDPGAVALQRAMKTVRDTPGGRFADPRYWAGFTLIGDGR